MQGSNYVKRPYDKVTARSTSVNVTVPSDGSTIVNGVHYKWENTEFRKGFTGSGSWFTSVAEGPTAAYFGTNNEDAAQEYVDFNGNLDDIFKNWQDDPEYDIGEYLAFQDAIRKETGDSCMDI